MGESTSRDPLADHDEFTSAVAHYVVAPVEDVADAHGHAALVLADTLGTALLATADRDAIESARPMFPTGLSHPARVPGTRWRADPVTAAFGFGCLVRWQDFNDTWLALEWGHPSDNLGGLLPLVDYLAALGRPLRGSDLLAALTRAHEIQGLLAQEVALNRRGLDHVAYVRVATAAVAAGLLTSDAAAVASAVSHALTDGAPLRAYRQAPNTGPRKSWAAADATSRGIWLALRASHGEPAVHTAVTAPRYGFSEAILGGEPIRLPRPLGTQVVSHVLLKPAWPAEYHAQSALEAALALRPYVAGRWDEITSIEVDTHEAAIRIIDKQGALSGPADRDHCLQYIVAAALLTGDVTAATYHEPLATDPQLESLRAKVQLREDRAFTCTYQDPTERAVANRVRVHFADGTATEPATVQFPVGHPRRRDEARPLVESKLAHGLDTALGAGRGHHVRELLSEPAKLADADLRSLIDDVIPNAAQ